MTRFRKKESGSGTDTAYPGHRNATGTPGRYPRRRVGRFTLTALVSCALLAILVAADHAASSGRIYSGVEVGSVNLGGKTTSEAEEIVRKRLSETTNRIELTAGPERFVLSRREIEARVAAGDVVKEAYAVGREGNVIERLSDRGRAYLGGINVEPRVRYSPEAVRDKVEEIASKLDRRPRDASVAVGASGAEVEEAKEGYETDIEATTQNVDYAITEMSGRARIAGEPLEPAVSTREAEAAAKKVRSALSSPLVFTADAGEWNVQPEQVAGAIEVDRNGDKLSVGLRKGGIGAYLAPMYESLNVSPVEAGFEVVGDEVRVTDGSAGQRIDDARLFKALESGVFAGQNRFEVPVEKDAPELTTGEAQRLKPTTLIGSYRTPYAETGDNSPERVRNLQVSSEAIDGTAVAPGEIFSFNDLAAGLDYEPAKVIVDGQVAYEDGGGLCQVSSTLYNAVYEAGLEVVERNPHSAELPYIRPGLDATVWFGGPGGAGELDMKFRNTADNYVLVRERVDADGYVHAEVWGRPGGREVELSSRRVSSDPASTSWVTYQTVRENGKVVSRGRLHSDTYEPLTDDRGRNIPNSEPAPREW